MKANKIFAVLLIGLAVAACNSKSAGDALPKEFQPSKAQVDSVSYLLGINFGGFMKNYDFGSDLNYGEIVKGIKDILNSKGNYMDPDFAKQFKVDLPGVSIKMDPGQADLLETRVIDGRSYLLIPVEGDISVNGQPVFTKM